MWTSEDLRGSLRSRGTALVGAVICALAPWSADLRAQSPAPVGSEFQVNTYTTGSQMDPALSADGTGNTVVVWSSQDGQDGHSAGVFGQRYDPLGSPAGGEFQVNAYTTSYQKLPSVATDAAGSFVVVWNTDGDLPSYSDVVGRRFDSSGSPLGAEFQVNTYTTSYQTLPAASTDDSGNFVVVWQTRGQLPPVEFSWDVPSGFWWDVFGQRYDSQGGAIGGEFQVNASAIFSQFAPAVSSDSAGNFVVAWFSVFHQGDYGAVLGQRHDSQGNPVGAEFQVNTHTTLYQRSPAISTTGAGDFVVVWESEEQDGSDLGVFGQRYDSQGAPQGGEFQVNTYTTGPQGRPSVATDDAGNFLVVWESLGQDGDESGIFGQLFDPLGTPWGAEFQINTHTTGTQLDPAVSSGALGGFVVVWESFGQDGSNEGVFGQRLAVSPSPGGTAAGFVSLRVTCKNTSTGQEVFGVPAAAAWDCAAFGLATSPGDRISMVVRGAASGVPPIAGSLTGLAMPPNARVRCANLTTGSAVQFPSGIPAWDCSAMGLGASAGDRLQVRLDGTGS